MSILIKGVNVKEIKRGAVAIVNIDDVGYFVHGDDIIPVPDHGDLIDRDELIGEMKHSFGEETIVTFTMKMKGFKSTIKTWLEEPMFAQQCNLTEFVRHSPVVIPAERREE